MSPTVSSVYLTLLIPGDLLLVATFAQLTVRHLRNLSMLSPDEFQPALPKVSPQTHMDLKQGETNC